MNPFLSARAVLFDLDGTLVETHIDFPFMKREMLNLVERFGIESGPLRELDILTAVEEARNRLVHDGRKDHGDRMRAEAFARLEEIEVEHCRNPVEIPGARGLVQRLRERGIRIGIVTRNCRKVSLDLIRFGGFECDALVARDDVPLTKPDPAHLLAALRVLGCPTTQRPRVPTTATGLRECDDLTTKHEDEDEPESPVAVMIGDHWMDVKAGRGAGLATVGILHGREPAFFEPARPDLLVDKPADLLPLVA